jgi:hypothetical protein
VDWTSTSNSVHQHEDHSSNIEFSKFWFSHIFFSNQGLSSRSFKMGVSVPTFNVGIRFEQLGKDTTSENNIEKAHWALVFTPSDGAEWSIRVEMVTDRDDVLFFPVRVSDARVDAHDLATFTGYLDDILELMLVHPMRGTPYSSRCNNCQHWAATLLVFMIAFSDSTSGRRYAVTNSQRHRKVLEALKSSGSSLFHTENWWLDSAQIVVVGGGAVAAGATAVAAEATALVPAAGILGWFGVTVAAPTAMAVAATALLPAVASGAAGAGAMYLYKSYWWRNFTTFPDPRRHGCPANGKPLSTQEKGESACASGGSLSGVSAGFSAGLASGLASASALSSGVLLGAYIGSNVARVLAAFSPGAAVKYAPSIARNVAYGVALGAKYVS